MIYLDHAATSWPKPPEVADAMCEYLAHAGGNPGRSGHSLSIAAARVIYETREVVAALLGVADPLRIIFTLNATSALNLVLMGLLRPGDQVVTTGLEHNAIARPLKALQNRGIAVRSIPSSADDSFTLEAVQAAITPGTRLVVVTHASNVTGAIIPLATMVDIVHRAGAMLLVDAAQSAGSVPLAVDADGIDFLAFSGHKGLLGPPGTGGFAIGPTVNITELAPVILGGTGSLSEMVEQPTFLPDKYESGTPNGVGLAGLGAGVRYVLQKGVNSLHAHERDLRSAIWRGLAAVPGVRLFGPPPGIDTTGVLSFTVEGMRVSEVAERLDDEYGVLCRVGLHCAPCAHQALGTFPEGTIRFAPGPFLTLAEVEWAVEAVRRILSR